MLDVTVQGFVSVASDPMTTDLCGCWMLLKETVLWCQQTIAGSGHWKKLKGSLAARTLPLCCRFETDYRFGSRLRNMRQQPGDNKDLHKHVCAALIRTTFNNWSGQASGGSPCPEMTSLCHCRTTQKKLGNCYEWLHVMSLPLYINTLSKKQPWRYKEEPNQRQKHVK